MGYFDLPRGNFELLLKKKGRGNHKAEWQSVMMTDHLYPGDVEEHFERWGINYKIMAARYNGREVKPLTRYHWERRFKDDILGKYATRAEAEAAVQEQRRRNWGVPIGERVMVGTIVFVQD